MDDSRDTGTVEGRLRAARNCCASGAWHEAGLHYRDLLQRDPAHGEANYGMGLVALQLGQPGHALAHFELALEVSPGDARCWLGYIEALERAGRREDARDLLAAARRQGLDGEEAEALARRLEVQRDAAARTKAKGKTMVKEKPGQGRPPSAAAIEAMAHKLERGDLAGAEADARRMARTHAGHWAGWKMLGVVLLQVGRASEAIPALEKAVALAPGDAEALNNLGIACMAAGRLAESAAAYRQALALKPDYAQAHCNLGATLHANGDLAAAESCYRDALRLQPDYVRARSNLGAVLVEAGRFAEAEDVLRAELRKGRTDADTSRNLAIALDAAGRGGEARELLQQAITGHPEDAASHRALGVILLRNGDYERAGASLRRAVELEPGNSEGHCLLGMLELTQFRTEAAEAHLARAIELDPDNVDALGGLGECLKQTERNEEAEAVLRKALALRPGDANLLNALSLVLLRRGCMDEAEARAHEAIRAERESAKSQLNLGFTLKAMDRLDEARTAFERAAGLGSAEARLALANLMPAIVIDRAEIRRVREHLSASLDALLADPPRFDDPQELLQSPNFFLAYHGENDRELQTKTARMLLGACPALQWTAPHCREGVPRRPGRRRIGFFSRYVRQHSVSTCFSRLVEGVSQSPDFDVALVSTQPVDPEVYSAFRGTVLRVPLVISAAREQIAALELDALIYLDIGMEATSYFLAFSRLAPLQCVVGGHPVTTGIPNLDCYLSTRAFEPPDAQAHYSEELVNLPHPPTIFAPPPVPAVLKSRAELGMPERGHLYVCPMKLQKLHPDFDVALGRILELDPDGQVVLFEDHSRTAWKQMVLDRLAATLPAESLRRVSFMPWLKDYRDFVAAVVHADVLLDPFHFGIGSTVVVIGVTGTPQVTLPGAFMRGRIGAYYNELLGVPECTVDSVEAYARQAVAIAVTPDLRADLVGRILANGRRLFLDQRPIDELAGFLRTRIGKP